jgi:hypothetical protein
MFYQIKINDRWAIFSQNGPLIYRSAKRYAQKYKYVELWTSVRGWEQENKKTLHLSASWKNGEKQDLASEAWKFVNKIF